MKGDNVVGGRRHKIGWEGRYSGGWKKTQHRIKGDTVVDGRRHSTG